MTRKILIVEDDVETAEDIARGLVEQGHEVDRAGDAHAGLSLASGGAFDLVILDRMLPGMDGLGMLRELRGADVSTPVLILSALGGVDDRVDGLEAGSDDYLVKPFAFAELLARVNALIRRGDGKPAPETRLSVGDLEIDLLSRAVRRGGRPLTLLPREYKLLEYLARNANRVVTRTMLLERVWDYHFDPGTNVVDVHIGRLRRKLEEGADWPILHTVRGAGYRLAAEG